MTHAARAALIGIIVVVVACLAAGETLAATPLLLSNVERPLRYRPDGRDFVIENGREFFNRPLYGSNTAFRIDAGDRPELSLYLPGRGGNFRFGVMTSSRGPKWLHEAAQIEARYRPGSMLYEIRDPDVPGVLRVSVLGMRETEGVIVRVTASEPVELLTACGGAGEQRGRRDGDIGTESQPVSQFFQLRPEFCQGNTFAIADGGQRFTLTAKSATLSGVSSMPARFEVADASRWNELPKLLESAGHAADRPVVVGRIALQADKPLYLALQRLSDTAAPPPLVQDKLAAIFDDAEKERQAIAAKVVVETPDPYINAAAAALCVAADGTWDARQTAVMHGAVAWRVRLLGWRGVYWCDALGYHDRTRQHLGNWLPKQNADPIANPFPPPPEATANLSRNETALHSNGDLTRSHYDMNMVAIDALLRHLLWTGDLEYARQVWPNIERHLAWERRLFRRTFGDGDDALPLYEGYANFWASDAVGYNGGGVAHASAYNYFHHRMAARIARLIGQDPTIYDREAELILRGMRRHLWLGRCGWFAEWKDSLGLQLVHENAALWTFYHVIDSGAATPTEAWQMSRFVDTQLAHIPLRGPGVPDDDNYYILPTTSWMPPMWSTNNVVVAESAHAALAMWQAGRDDEAFRLFKGTLLATMYSGLCPGNVGMCTQFDVSRGESQRDFTDGVGAVSRTLVEGLFGVHPDALSGELLLRPGLPPKWERASLKHPSVSVAFTREGEIETYRASFGSGKRMALRLQAPALRDDVASVLVNGKPAPATWRCLEDEIGRPRIEVLAESAAEHEVRIEWRGQSPAAPPGALVAARGEPLRVGVAPAQAIEVIDPQATLIEPSIKGNSVDAIAAGEIGHRTFFVKVRRGKLTWCTNVFVELRPPVEVIPTEEQPPDQLTFAIRNNSGQTLRGSTGGAKFNIPPHSISERFFRTDGIVPGTNRVDVKLESGDNVTANITNWRVSRSPAPASFEPIDMRPHFNDRVTQIFRNEYLAPRSPYVSLAVPKQGMSNWCKPAETFEVDDAGLRRAADEGGGRIVLPPGIPFDTSGAGAGEAKNILFTSRWDNYPAEASIPLAGRASHVYLLMAGSTNSMLSQFDNGEVILTYAGGASERLALRNPTTWWPIDQDFFLDDFSFARPEPIPPRIDLRTGKVRVTTLAQFKGQGRTVPGGAATVLDLPLDPAKELKSLTVRSLANEVVIGLMAATLVR
jgi:hypothetical protein